ncbi:MAG TPA: membrane protein insertion efficiency factor YidD [Bacteroidia bacterium]
MQKLLNRILFILMLLASSAVFGQAKKSDKELLLNQNFYQSDLETKRNVTFLLSRKKNPVIRYNPVSLAFGGLLYVYQKFLSPQISTNCPYNPSCSGFSKGAILKYGFIKGIALSADRLTRCNSIAAKDITYLDFKDGKIDDDPDKYRLKK